MLARLSVQPRPARAGDPRRAVPARAGPRAVAGLGRSASSSRPGGGRRRGSPGRTRCRPPSWPGPAGRRGGRDRHGVGQVAGLPAAGAHRHSSRLDAPSGARGHGAVPLAHQGAGGRPAGAPSVALELPGRGRPRYDGDTADRGPRDWVRRHAGVVLTNPDMLHRSMLPGHARWAGFLRGLRYVVVDECHSYRGVFGSHVAAVLRRLRRVCAHYGADPMFVLASATVADPEVSAPADRSARGRAGDRRRLAARGDGVRAVGAAADRPRRRARGAGTADRHRRDRRPARRPGRRRRAHVAFVRSRRGGRDGRRERPAAAGRGRPEPVAAGSRPTAPATCPRSGARWRRRCSPASCWASRRPTRSSSGVDIAGLDAVLLAGWPGTRASLWQQAGRAGRGRRRARWRCWSPATTRWTPTSCTTRRRCSARPVEATVLDPDNPYVLAPHLCAAAAELPLHRRRPGAVRAATPAEVADRLVGRGLLRRRAGRAGSGPAPSGPATWPTSAAPAARRCGWSRRTPAGCSARSTARRRTRRVHAGAVYVHQGETYLVSRRSTSRSTSALVEPADPDWTHGGPRRHRHPGRRDRRATRAWGAVDAVVRHRAGDQPGRVVPAPARASPARCSARSRWTCRRGTCAPGRSGGRSAEVLARRAGLDGRRRARGRRTPPSTPRSGCCRCSRPATAGTSAGCRPRMHADTGRPTVFVYDGHPGGAGFAERGLRAAGDWLTATRDAIAACECLDGLPVVRAVAEVRQRQRAAGQGRRRPAARRRARSGAEG